MIKGFRQIASLTATSRVFGFVRDIAYSHFFGANALLDAWTIAFKIPNLARRLFGEGAASASFIPVYSEQLHKDKEKAKQLVNTVVTALFVLLAAIVLIGQAGIWGYYKFFSPPSETRLVLSLTSIMLPYMLMVCIVAILAGILNVHRHFAAPAAAPIVLNIFIIVSILLTGWVFKLQAREQLFFVAAAVLIAGIVQIAIQLPPLRASGVSIKPAWMVHSEAFKKIIILMAPTDEHSGRRPYCMVVFGLTGKRKLFPPAGRKNNIPPAARLGVTSLLCPKAVSVTAGCVRNIISDSYLPRNELLIGKERFHWIGPYHFAGPLLLLFYHDTRNNRTYSNSQSPNLAGLSTRPIHRRRH
jgi:hypothetical protein